MTDQHDNEIIQPNSDGELSEDALFEWDGENWIPKTHEPFLGYDEPQEWIEPPRQIYPPPRRTRNVEPEEIEGSPDAGSTFNYKGAFGVLFVLLVIYGLFNMQGGNDNSVNSVVIPSATPSYVVIPATPTPTKTASPQPPTLTPSATFTYIPQPTPVPQYADCDVPIPYTAYVMATGNFVIAVALNRTIETCLWAMIDKVMIDPQLSADGQHLYFLSSGLVFVYDGVSGELRLLNNTRPILPMRHFDLSPDNTRIVYAEEDILYIYDMQTGRNTNFSPTAGGSGIGFPVWSPDGQAIYFSSGSQIARVSADNSDYQVIYEDTSLVGNFYDLAVSDDGEKIAALYSTTISDSARAVLVLDIASGDARHIVRYSPLSNPQWLPTSEHIALMEEQVGSLFTPQVFTFNLGGDMVGAMNSPHPDSWVLSGFEIWEGAD